MWNYFRKSFSRKLARRKFREYPFEISKFQVENKTIEFANWMNPLVAPVKITQEQVDFFRKFIREGDLVIDIGANIGHMSVVMSLLNGRKGHTLSFDPNPHVFRILNKNSLLNTEYTNIKPFPYAISEEDGEFYYNSSEASFNNGGISKEQNNRHGKFALSEKIKGINLEKFLKENYPEELKSLSLIKIDTEGYDRYILGSISNLIDQYKPVIISECFGKNTDEERFEHFQLLHSKGYSLFYFEDFSSNTMIIPITKKEDMLNWKHFDLYAQKSE